MTNKELVKNAIEYLNQSTCYLKGFWCQYLSKPEYDRINAQYKGANDKYNNTKYIGTNVYAGDCICWIKQLLGGGLFKLCADVSEPARRLHEPNVL